ncbi:hypothetical protein [Streptomyces sp. H27-D2]|uniref:hypothetical protein n=1 Tax=Streptomyces sp. H27-D2 TaxID=3046304 RepID=UPI002DBB6A61|nr:hypothetical protein [Streptomyces sp. H27-D2]MEC4019434.1 hypothetical protein [Streptomyces sp. H27-D2]
MPPTSSMSPQPGRAQAAGWSARDGLAVLGGPATRLLRALDDVFTGWGTAAGAEELTFPPLLRAADLAGLDYFRNFPHLGTVVTRIRPERHAAYCTARTVATIPARDVTDTEHVLPSAACYAGFLHLAGSAVDAGPVLLTTAARCFRNEERYDGLRRLWGFTMREIVCIGSADDVRRHLALQHEALTAFAGGLGLVLGRQPATDPFFERDGSRAFTQLLAPVKEEYVHADGTAVASMNNHRNFFGERCGISLRDRPAFTGCVAFGLERWVHALGELFDGDLATARTAVLRAGAAQ